MSERTLFAAVNAKYVHTNIAVRYLTRFCKNRGIDCDFCEFSINEPKDRVLEKLYMSGCDIYGFSCYIWNKEYVFQICKDLKQLLPDCRIVLGGPEVSYDAENILGESDFVDWIICGEGELATAELLANPPGERGVIHGRAAEDMDELPFPYSDSDLRQVVEGEKLVYYETSRGCPFNCSYCLSSVNKGVRFLPMERVKGEIRRMVDAGAMTIKFVDRTFNADRDRAFEIWKYCMALEGDTCFHFEIGADLLSDELIELMRKAPEGKIQFEIGVQTTNEKTISAVSRTMNLETLKANVIKLRESTKVHLHLDLIAGLPYEDYISFSNSFNDVYALCPNVLQLGFLKLLKGSALREQAKEYGIVYSATAPYEVFFTNWISYDDIIRLKAVEDVLERYFNSERFCLTLAAAVPLFRSPFDFYERLSVFWSERGLVGRGVKRITLYSLMYEFLNTVIDGEAMKTVIGEMKKDFSAWHSNGVGTPEWYRKYE